MEEALFSLTLSTMNKVMYSAQTGHVSIEWVVATLIMVMALFAPIPGEDQSVVGVLMMAMRDFYASMTLLLSLP